MAALLCVVRGGRLGIVKALIQAGVDANFCGDLSLGSVPPLCAVRVEQPSGMYIARALIDAGADVSQRLRYLGRTVFYEIGLHTTAIWLFAHHKRVHAKYISRGGKEFRYSWSSLTLGVVQTPKELHYAMRCVKMLLDEGVDMSIEDEQGLQPYLFGHNPGEAGLRIMLDIWEEIAM